MLSPLCFKTLAYVVPVGVTNKASDFLLVLVCTDSGINFICEFALSLDGWPRFAPGFWALTWE
jgi:hypothetical protein